MAKLAFAMSIADFSIICADRKPWTWKLACISDVASIASTVMWGEMDEYGGDQLCVECVTM